MSLGVKKFVDYTNLTANEINQYLMQQSVMVFASSAARTAAFLTAGVTITEGMVTYLLDTNAYQVYDGAAWVNPNQTTQNPTGLEFITEATTTNTTSTFNIYGCFSSTYENYRIVMTGVTTAVANSVYWKGITGVTVNSSVAYSYTNVGLSTRGAAISASAFDQTSAYLGFDCYLNDGNSGAFDIYRPYIATRTFTYGNTSGLNSGYNGFNMRNCSTSMDSAVSFDGIQLLTNGSNLTAKVRIYGYRQS